MGSFLSTPPPPSPELAEPWRKTDCQTDAILNKVKAFKPSTEVLRIMLYGPIGAGKSSFVNSVQRVILGRNAMSALENNTGAGTSFTKKLNIHKLKSARGEYYPLEIVDMMGLQSSEGGIKQEDIIKAFEGHISDGYIFNPGTQITKEDPKYKKDPTLPEKVHCLVCVLSANFLSIMEPTVFNQMKHVRDAASLLGIPQVIVMTKVDMACELVSGDLNKMYHSKKIRDKVIECSVNVGFPLNAIYPVMNYSQSVTQDKSIDLFILTALSDILNFANDYVERELEKSK